MTPTHCPFPGRGSRHMLLMLQYVCGPSPSLGKGRTRFRRCPRERQALWAIPSPPKHPTPLCPDQPSAFSIRTSPRTPRVAASLVVSYSSQTAFSLLEHACHMVTDLMNHGANASDHSTASNVMAAMMHTSFMSVVADAVRRMVPTSAILSSETAALDPSCDVQQAGFMVLTVCQYALTLTETLVYLLRKAGAFTGTSAQIRIPPDIVRALTAVVDSQLLAATAIALVDFRPFDGTLPLKQVVRERIVAVMQQGAMAAAKATVNVHQLQQELDRVGGPEGKRLSAGLRGVVRHEAVRRLRVGLLDRLAVHAGLGAKLEEIQGGLGLQGVRADAREEQAGAEQVGWEGLSGAWWFAGEEARRAQQGLGPGGEDGASGSAGRQAFGETGGWLEDHHCHAVYATFVQWMLDGQAAEGAAAEGVLDRPPPLLVARLAARAAEALCRLCRGEGLGGAYSPAPEWQFAMAQVCGHEENVL